MNRLADDHAHAREIAQAIASCRSEIATVDLKRVQSNIIMVEINPKYLTVREFCDRMAIVSCFRLITGSS